MIMKILLAISGASGVIYGKRLAEELSKEESVELDIVLSDTAKELIEVELDVSTEYIQGLARNYYDPNQLDAPPASGSSLYDAFLIVPCSMSTLSKIANGISDNLITRAGAVSLKEGNKLLLVPRETPFSTVYLKNMKILSESGAVILPACPGFYSLPENINEMVDFIVGKILDNIGIYNDLYSRWDFD